MRPMRIALATHAGQPDLDPDEAPFVAALGAAGHEVAASVWNDPVVDWDAFDVVLPRSCWDYHLRYAAFRRWLDRLEVAGAAVFNPIPVIRWNIDKRHLVDLAEQGAAVTPTRFLERGASASLTGLLRDEGWERAVVKPAVSLSAHGTWRTDRDRAARDQARLDAQLGEGGMLVQPYLDAVEREGELSFVFIDGACTHAVLKRPADGDFRVQAELGGRRERVEPSAAHLEQATALAARAPGPCLYLRVDAVPVDGRLLLVELECIDPELFLRLAPEAPGHLVAALERAVDGGGTPQPA